MELTAWLGLATLVIGFPLNVTATLLLLKKSRQAPHLRVLKERYRVAIITTVLVLVFGLIFVNNDQAIPPLSVDTTKLITRSMLLVMAVVPAVGWIRLYRSTGRRKEVH